MDTIELRVDGMTCGGCTARLKRVLEALPGVATAEPVLDGGRVSVVRDPARVDAAAIRAAIEDAGFTVAGG